MAFDWIIYVLKCPRTLAVKYVGWTSRSPEARLYSHVYESLLPSARTRKERWILSLLSIGLNPVIEVIGTGAGTSFKDDERRWIAFYRAQGCDLVNETDGGDGPSPGMLTPELRRAKAIKAMASRTPEQRSEAARKTRMGLTPEERRANIDKANARRTFEQHSLAMKKGKAGMTPEARSAVARIAATALHANRTPEEERAAQKRASQAPRLSTRGALNWQNRARSITPG